MRFGVLGPLTVESDGASVEISAPKQRALLILLIIEAGRTVPAEVILDRLWPERPPSAGLKTLRFHVSKLRSVLEPGVKGSGFTVVETRDDGYFVDGTAHEIDSRRFEQLAGDGQREMANRPDRAHRLLSDALAMWRGRALHDVAYADFAAAEARRLEARRLSSLEDRIACELDLGRIAGVVEELEELAESHPTRERVTELLMQALYSTGRAAEAIAAAERLRRRLADVGLEPSPAIYRLEHHILTHDESLSVPSGPAIIDRAPPLPVRLTSFIGRNTEIRYVEAALRDRRLVTIVGPPGSGKSRLALEVGRRVAEAYPDGAAWIELGDVSKARLVAQAFGAGLGIVAPRTVDYAELIVTRLRNRRGLVVVDNCEHLLRPAGSLILAMLHACPDVTVLATSREPLGLPGEHIWSIPPFELPAAGARLVDGAADVESVRLFVERAQEAHPAFVFDQSNVADVATICRRLDGLPLAIELTASATEAMTVRQILQRLDRRSVNVPATPRHGVSRQATMDEAIRWSFDLLQPTDQVVLTRLAAFVGGFTMEAAEAVAGWGAVRSDEVFDAVLRLVHHSLVEARRHADGQVRYRMLMVLRRFGQLELKARGETAEIDLRHAEHYAGVAEAIAPHLEGRRASRSREIADTELDNFRAAMEASIRLGRIDTAMRIDAALTWHWYWRSYLEEGKRWGDRILAADPSGPPSEPRARVLYAAGIFETILGQLADGTRSFERAGAMASGLGLDALEARTLTGRGVNARDRGRLAAALSYLHRAEAIDRRVGDEGHLALTLRFVGVVRFMLGDLDGARTALNETVELFAAAGNRGGMGWGIEGKARVAFRAGDEDGFALADEAAALYAAVHDRRNQAWLLIRTGLARLVAGALDDAVSDLLESFRLFADMGDRRGVAYAEQHLGIIELKRSKLDAGRVRLDAALERFAQIGELGGLSSTNGWLTVLDVLAGNPSAAVEHGRAWLDLPPEDRYVWSVLDVLADLRLALLETDGVVAEIVAAHDRLQLALATGSEVLEAVAAVDEAMSALTS